ncbi:MAG: Altronate dehydratase [Candidatus Daviesbacteria bacterium GW2011_GWF2_38_6]|uniref:Altronate dehydratase n=1 Tax=Candidatus Daviesbacteria bacterium GW2011_GWF2_38_6 TaxID=1618432 RepID=A0A0G0KRX8_9BACT|nr:MAG: Altronate dehydratase [Candidatus Daviesbacteria bacterium GW2011_GWF2_38_6]
MNGPGNDFESMTGIVASGANVILFSTGMGTTEGNLIAPVVKLSSRTEVYEKMGEDIDFNAGALLDESISMEQLSDKLLDIVIEVASGKTRQVVDQDGVELSILARSDQRGKG